MEGRQAVAELLRAGRRRVHQVFLSEAVAPHDRLEEIADLASAAGVTVRRVSRDRIEEMARSEAPQGVVALAAPVRPSQLDDLVLAADPFLVVLDGVTDPHNLGAVMRSAVCAGATGLVLGRHRSAPLSPAAVKAAAGAVEHLPVAVVPGIPAALKTLAERGIWTVGFDAAGPSRLWELGVLTEGVAVVLGAEGRGLSPLTRSRCEVLARIPMSGPLGSLNVSAAAALACFEVARQRSRAN
ncbi:MAG: 23S rRNA (guanosine(2251)-2'-O)-methyltransferase RlmB [Acidobacteriota bacterium]|nr:23S rRNA (guanosine(2251)-2'-O)-methyltransferase RlmB [Acidobacteriota bacterium]